MTYSGTQKIGQAAETLALEYLKQQGLSLITRNFNCRLGEIDLILKDQDTLVFAEIRYRQKGSHGDAVSTVDFVKQRKLLRSAEYYLQVQNIKDNQACRFDVLGLSLDAREQVNIDWHKNAFEAEELR